MMGANWSNLRIIAVLFLLMAFLFRPPLAFSQNDADWDTVIVGQSEGTNNHPFRTSFTTVRSQYIYPASEIGWSGQIGAISFDVSKASEQAMNLCIRMKHTPLASFSSQEWDTDFETVFREGTFTIGDTGWNRIDFDTPFFYNGRDNLMIDISFYDFSASEDGLVRAFKAPDKRLLYARINDDAGDPTTWAGTSPELMDSTAVPVLKIHFLPGTGGAISKSKDSGGAVVIIVILIVMIGLLALMAAISFKRFQALAREFNGKFRYYGLISSLSFKHGGADFRIRARAGSRRSRFLSARLTVERAMKMGFELSVVPRSFFSGLSLKSVTMKDVTTGDPAFDTQFIIRSSHFQRAGAFFQDPLRRDAAARILGAGFDEIISRPEQIVAVKRRYPLKLLKVETMTAVVQGLADMKAAGPQRARTMTAASPAPAAPRHDPAGAEPFGTAGPGFDGPPPPALADEPAAGLDDGAAPAYPPADSIMGVDQLIAQGNSLFSQGEYGDACQYFKQAADLNPNYTPALQRLVEAGRLAGEDGILQEAAGLLAKQLGRNNKIKECCELYRKVKETCPDFTLPIKEQLALAQWLSGQSQFMDSARAYREAAVKYPDHPGAPQALLRCAELLAKRCGQPAKAAQIWAYIIKKYPGSPAATQAQAASQHTASSS